MPAVTVKLTASDIADGEKRSCGNCPVKRALQRVVATGIHVSVGVVDALLTRMDADGKGYKDAIVHLPAVAQDFISRFDNSEIVELIAFPVEIPKEFLAVQEVLA